MKGLLMLIVFSVVAVVAAAFLFLRTFSVLTYEKPIATVVVEKLAPKRYAADVTFENGHEERFLIAGEQIEFSVEHILLRNWAKFFRSDATDRALYRFNGLAGRYSDRRANFPECSKEELKFISDHADCETNYSLSGKTYNDNGAENPSWLDAVGKMVVSSGIAQRQDGYAAYANKLANGKYEVCLTTTGVLVVPDCNNTLIKQILN